MGPAPPLSPPPITYQSAFHGDPDDDEHAAAADHLHAMRGEAPGGSAIDDMIAAGITASSPTGRRPR
jgi:hypothetical protein